jgi:hypothetical protein
MHPRMLKLLQQLVKTNYLLVIILLVWEMPSYGQSLQLKARSKSARGGQAFAALIKDSTLSLEKREEMIFLEIKSGNVPEFLRKLVPILSRAEKEELSITYFVLPDYFAIGSNEDFFYVPMTPILAQRVAVLLKCSLPTKKMVDTIYRNAAIKLVPKPIPPTPAMTTVPVFMVHNDTLKKQLLPYSIEHSKGMLTAGNKKDLIISNKIYTEKTDKVVIYGWHQLNGKPIQPVYNKHTNLWADYSHGIRFVLQKTILHLGKSNKKTTISKILTGNYSYLISDEGIIDKSFYPITSYKSIN